MAQANIIKVSDSATLKVAPDTMRIRIEVNSHFASNEAAYEQAKFNSLQVLASLKNVGLDESIAKTVNFDISEDSKPIYEKGRWTGYTCFSAQLSISPYTWLIKNSAYIVCGLPTKFSFLATAT